MEVKPKDDTEKGADEMPNIPLPTFSNNSLFGMPKYRETEGKVIAMRRILETSERLLEKLNEKNVKGMSYDEKEAHVKWVAELTAMRDKALAFIKQTENRKLDDLHQGNQRGLQSSDLPARLRADSPEWKAMSFEERKAYLSGRNGLKSGSLSPLGFGLKEIADAPKAVEINFDPFGGSNPTNQHEWLSEWKKWEDSNKTEWRKTVYLPEGPVLIGNRTRKEIGMVKRTESLAHHYQAATKLPELLANSKLAVVEEPVGKPEAREIHKRYAWADFPDGKRRHVLMTVIRWNDESIKSDTAYSLEAIEVQEEAANASEGYYTPTLAAHAATGDTGNFAQFKAGVKSDHRVNPGLKASPAPTPTQFTFSPDPKKVAELRDQQAAFDKQMVGAPRLANPGNSTRSRSEQDLVDQLYEEGRTVQENADTMQEARRLFATDPGGSLGLIRATAAFNRPGSIAPW